MSFKCLKLLLLCIFAFSLVERTTIAQLVHSEPAVIGMDDERLACIDQLVTKHIAQGRMPGCVVTVGRCGKVVFQKAYGHRQLKPRKHPMTVDTVFDLASLTKPIATAASIMVLIDRGQLRLGDRVAMHIPEFGQNGKDQITVQQLLTHVGGLIADNAMDDYRGAVADAWKQIWKVQLIAKPGERFIYSDVGFIVLAELVKKISGQNVDEFSRQNIFDPLGMNDTGYLPHESLRKRAATTEQRDGKWMQGEVHDPRAHALGGIAGHAGLFSTSDDLAIYSQMMLSHGKFNGA